MKEVRWFDTKKTNGGGVRVRNLSEITSTLYIGAAERFAKYHGRSPVQLGPEQVREFFLHLLDDKRVTANTIQLYRSALKFLYAKTLRRPWFDEGVARIKQRLRLPTVLSAEEIACILDRTSNLKHWTIIATLYATGLRVSELRRLKVSDIDSPRMLIHVRQGKGRIPARYRLVAGPAGTARRLLVEDKPKDWLFPGQRPDFLLDDRTIRLVCRKAARRAGITTKRVSPHVFRHSCAPHMLEAGAA